MDWTSRRSLTALTPVAALSLMLSGCASVGDSEEPEEAETQQEDTATQDRTDEASEETEDPEEPEDDADLSPAPSAATEQGGFVLSSPTELEPGTAPEEVDLEELPTSEEPGLPGGLRTPEESEPLHVVIYSDPSCPHCADFEDQYGDFLEDELDEGTITVEYRTMTFVDAEASPEASNAFSCMAEESPENYLPYLSEVTRADQALSPEELAEIAEDDYDAEISSCIEEGTYLDFAQYTTDLAQEEGLRGTPTVYAGEEQWETSEDFEEWIQDQLADHAD